MTGDPGSVPFEIKPDLRQPAAELGPRAQRTISLLLGATRTVFMTQGYRGTAIEDITREAGVSRGSFYTYFPTKRDALLAVGADANERFHAVIEELGSLDPAGVTLEVVTAWMERYFDLLDRYGAFIVTWMEAALGDEELRTAAMRGQFGSCRRLGQALETLRGRPFGDPVYQGFLVSSMVERAWTYARHYGDAVDDGDVTRNAAMIVMATLTRTA
ncbi:MAG: putative transcription regulator [Frankiales bacterium]|nr:putative transcription regulator [Frankiales bacterium]